MNISVIIAAAGAGKRFGGSTPKQYKIIDGVTVLEKTLNAFCGFKEIIIASDDPGRARAVAEPWAKKWAPGAALKYAKGGAQRLDSVANALELVTGEYVLIHDAARPFVGSEVIKGVTDALKAGAKSAVPCVAPKDTIRTEGGTLKRDELYIVQTPQGFETAALRDAYKAAKKKGLFATDDAGIMESAGYKTVITQGDYKNIKITTQEDMPMQIRIGNGYDVHRLVEGRPLMLGCTKIPYEKGLLGHSDADVLAHAIADSLLGAAALGDIGHIFPDTAKETEGMAGAEILRQTVELIRNLGYTVMMVDSTVIAEKPKLAEYIETMRENTAKALGTDKSQISIKATTEEGLGERSRDGIAAFATCTLKG